MEISEREIRRMAHDVDEQHRDGMATMANDIAELHAETRRFRATQPTPDAARRVALRTAGALAIGTTALTLRSMLPASAADLTDADIAAFAESVELAAVEAYKAAAGSGKLQPAVVEVGTTFAGHHAE